MFYTWIGVSPSVNIQLHMSVIICAPLTNGCITAKRKKYTCAYRKCGNYLCIFVIASFICRLQNIQQWREKSVLSRPPFLPFSLPLLSHIIPPSLSLSIHYPFQSYIYKSISFFFSLSLKRSLRLSISLSSSPSSSIIPSFLLSLDSLFISSHSVSFLAFSSLSFQHSLSASPCFPLYLLFCFFCSLPIWKKNW